jgi:hypothetical protein
VQTQQPAIMQPIQAMTANLPKIEVMRSVVSEFLLLSSLGAFFVGLVIAAASLIG